MSNNIDNIVEGIESNEQFEKYLKNFSTLVVHFWAPWATACQKMDKVFSELANKNIKTAKFIKIEAENFPELSQQYEISSVPCFKFFKNGSVVATVVGFNPPLLGQTVSKTCTTSLEESGNNNTNNNTGQNNSGIDINERLKKLVSHAPVMLFMKGTPAEPKCGFSRKMVDLLKEQKIKFSSFDILSDNEVRDGLKKMFEWPTYPQLYCNGKLLGGLDVVTQLKEDGELMENIPEEAQLINEEKKQELINQKLLNLVSKEPVMLFMKGSPAEPKCGFSRKMVDLLNGQNIQYGSFDILSDNEVREGLKKMFEWPTYPQLYSKGKLVGGLDVVTQLKEDGELLEYIPETSIISNK